MVIFYVEDLIVFAETEKQIDMVKTKLWKRFKVKNLSKPKQFLGIELVCKDNGSVGMRRSRLISKLL